MIAWEVWSRVVEFTGERLRPGTAFLVGSGSEQVLVTARHLCTNDPDETLTLRHPWTNSGFAFQTLASRVAMEVAPRADFAIFRTEQPIIDVGVDVPLESDSFFYSQTAYILGYPHGLSTQANAVQRIPIVKSCIIAGTRINDDGVDEIFVDTLVNPGFSGGPLVFIDTETKRPKFAGVVTQGMSGPLYAPTEAEPDPPRGPAGIGIVVRETAFRSALG